MHKVAQSHRAAQLAITRERADTYLAAAIGALAFLAAEFAGIIYVCGGWPWN